MKNPIVADQMKLLQTKFPDATCEDIGHGRHLISVPHVPLVAGWDAKETTVLFIAPAGYPAACPQHFWTTPELRLNHDGVSFTDAAYNTNTGNKAPGRESLSVTWFVLRLQDWNPNCCSLLTYLRVIQRRLQYTRRHSPLSRSEGE